MRSDSFPNVSLRALKEINSLVLLYVKVSMQAHKYLKQYGGKILHDTAPCPKRYRKVNVLL